MSRRAPVRGYRSQRAGGGCVTPIVWLGILLNLGLIIYSVTNGSGLSFGHLTGNATESALRALNAGEFTTAIGHAQEALSAQSTDTVATMTLVRALVYRSYVDFNRAADLTEALDTAEIALGRTPNDPNILAAYAFALQANGQAVTAVEQAERALELDPNHTLARTALALGYARVGSFEIALRESTAAIDANPNSAETVDAYRAQAISTADLGNYAEAGEMIDSLLQGYRGFIPLYFERALYANQVSDYARAESAYFAVLTIDPQNVKARMRLCELASRIGENDTAMDYCTQVTQLSPNIPDGWYRLGRLHFLAGDFVNAQAALNQCSTRQVRQGVPPAERIFECWYLQGQAAEILGDCDALTTVYNEFLLMAADNAVRETWTYPPEGPPICQTG